MAALAYLLPPLTGLLAYITGSTPRARFNGLQAVTFGVSWPLLLYVASALSPRVTQGVFALGVVVWLVLLGATAFGAQPRLPGVGGFLERAAERGPRERLD